MLTTLQKHNKISNRFPIHLNGESASAKGNEGKDTSLTSGVQGFTYKQAITLFYTEGLAKDEEEGNNAWELLQEQGVLKEGII